MSAISMQRYRSFAGRIRERGADINSYLSLVGVNFILAGFSFATTLVLANLLGREGFGNLSYALAIGGYCLSLAYCGLEQTLVRDLVQSPESFGEVFSASLLLRGCLLAVALTGILVLNVFSPPGDRLSAAGVLIVMTEGIRALCMSEVYDAWSNSRRNTLYLLAERCIYFASIWGVILVFKDRLSLGTIALFMCSSMLLGLVLQYRWALPRLRLFLNRSIAARAGRMLLGNLWVWSAVLATLSFGTLSKIVLRHIDGSAELGGYSVAWQVVPLGLILISQAARLGKPYMAKMAINDHSFSERVHFLLRYGALAILAGSIIGLPAILFPGAILRIFRPEYASVEGALRILGVYVILLGIGQVAAQYLIAVRKERTYGLVVMITGVLSIALYSVCIPRWSAEGAALAVVLAHGTAITLYIVAVIRHLTHQRLEMAGNVCEGSETRTAGKAHRNQG